MNIISRTSTLYFLLAPIKQYYRQAKFKSEWRKNNKHNLTNAVNIFPINKVSVGKYTYGDLTIYAFGDENEGLEIGNYCSIAGNVTFILGGEHQLHNISTFPISRHIFNENYFTVKDTKGKIIIEDDVWIGNGVTVLSGVHIGQGAVIGAGSVVTKNVPPYSIFIGNDVKKYRFNNNVVQKLLKINYKKLDFTTIDNFNEICKEKVTENNINDILKLMK